LSRACILTLGCPKNEADSDSFAACLENAGWTLTDDPGDADLLLLNTCAFISPAVEESLEVMDEAVDWKTRRSGRRLVLAGCLPGRFEDDGSGGLEDFDLVIGPADTRGLGNFLGLAREPFPGVSGSGHIRYLKISEGCSNGCSYCTIPLIRGSRRDRPEELILEEARQLVKQGAAEIGVVGQDTGAWNPSGGGVRHLLERLAAEHPLVWFRLYYVHPAHRIPDLEGLLAGHSNIMPYVDMPVQHFSDEVLSRMGRGYSGDDLEGIFSEFDGFAPRVSVRTTVITGYPGETEEDFAMLEDFLARHRCIRTIAAFPYWPEEGTLEFARSTGDDPLPEGTAGWRLSRIGEVADMHYRRWGDILEGEVVQVMADDGGTGHTRFDAPEVDGACSLDRELPPGTVVSCRITGSEGPDLTGEVI